MNKLSLICSTSISTAPFHTIIHSSHQIPFRFIHLIYYSTSSKHSIYDDARHTRVRRASHARQTPVSRESQMTRVWRAWKTRSVTAPLNWHPNPHAALVRHWFQHWLPVLSKCWVPALEPAPKWKSARYWDGSAGPALVFQQWCGAA